MSDQNIVGSVGASVAIPSSSLSPIEDPGLSYPALNDIIYGANSAQMFVDRLHVSSSDGDAVRGIIVAAPPASGNWSNLSGAINNNQFLPAQTTGGQTAGVVGIDSNNAVQLGVSENAANIRSSGRATNNGNELAYQADVQAVQGALSDETTRAQAAEAAAVASAKSYADQAVASAQIASAKWLPATQTFADLPNPPPVREQNYLANVLNDPDTSKNATWQWIGDAATTNWTYFGTDANYVSPAYLSEHGYLQGADVVNSLSSTATTAPLSAAQGKALDAKIATVQGYFTNGKANGAATADTAAAAAKLSTARTVAVNLSGYASGSGSATFDGSGDATINISTIGVKTGYGASAQAATTAGTGNKYGWLKIFQGAPSQYGNSIKIDIDSGMWGFFTISYGWRGNSSSELRHPGIIFYGGDIYPGGTVPASSTPIQLRQYCTTIGYGTCQWWIYIPSYGIATFSGKVFGETALSLTGFNGGNSDLVTNGDTLDANMKAAGYTGRINVQSKDAPSSTGVGFMPATINATTL
jgi:hypothetical protein